MYLEKKIVFSFLFKNIQIGFERFAKKKSVTQMREAPLINADGKATLKISKSFSDLIHHLMLILRIIRLLKWQSSSLRTLKFVNEKEILFINDASCFQGENLKNKGEYSFIRNKFIRLKLLYLKKKFKQLLWVLGNLIIFFSFKPFM